MTTKVQTLVWYLRRPRLLPDMLNLLARRWGLRKRSALNDTREAATTWCISCAVDVNTAVTKVTGRPAPRSVRSEFPEVFAEADHRATSCPVSMGGGASVDLLYWLSEHLEARRVVETGVAYGWSSLAFLLSLQHRSGSHLISTDRPYIGSESDLYAGCVVPQELRSQWSILQYADRQALPAALKRSHPIDICHYDSDKSYEGRMWAYPRMWKALRRGGLLVSDDVGDNIAFQNFCQMVDATPVVVNLQSKYAGLLVRSSDPPGLSSPLAQK